MHIAESSSKTISNDGSMTIQISS